MSVSTAIVDWARDASAATEHRVVTDIDSLLCDEDDSADVGRSRSPTPPPPPPPILGAGSHHDVDEHDAEPSTATTTTTSRRSASSSSRSSPDEMYSDHHDHATPVIVAPPPSEHTSASSGSPATSPSAHAASSKSFVPFFRSGACLDEAGDAAALEELEAASARHDDDDASFNGGATDDDGEDEDMEEDSSSDDDESLEDDEVGSAFVNPYANFIITASHDPVCHATEEDDDDDGDEPILGDDDEVDSECDHPFLDMDTQLRQVEWDRSQQRAAYHADMQRRVAMDSEDRRKALMCLMNEAHRYHDAKKGAAPESFVPSTVWRELAQTVADDADTSGPANAQRNLSCMCIFSLHSAAREYGDHEDERMRRHMVQQRTLQQLRMQEARGGSSCFLRPGTPMPAAVDHREL